MKRSVYRAGRAGISSHSLARVHRSALSKCVCVLRGASSTLTYSINHTPNCRTPVIFLGDHMKLLHIRCGSSLRGALLPRKRCLLISLCPHGRHEYVVWRCNGVKGRVVVRVVFDEVLPPVCSSLRPAAHGFKFNVCSSVQTR